MEFLFSIVKFLGILGVLRFAYYVYKICYTYFSKPKNLKDEKVQWCMITGASSGVGYELAKKVASQGVNLIILGRNAERLTNLEIDIKNQPGNQIEIIKIPLDFSNLKESTKIFSEIIPSKSQNGKITVDVLFICHGAAEIKAIENLADEEIEQYNNSYITSNIIMTKEFAKQGGKGMTVCSSANSFVYTGYIVQYGAVKRWMNVFYNSIKIELDFPVQILNIGVIKNTRFFDNVPEGAKKLVTPPDSALTPERVAGFVLSSYGTNFEVDVGTDCILYRILFWLFPPFIIDKILASLGRKFGEGIKVKAE